MTKRCTHLRAHPWLCFAQIVILICALIISGNVTARESQDPLNRRITLSLKTSLENVLKELEMIAQVKFLYSSSRIPVHEIVSIQVTEKKLRDILSELLDTRDIGYELHADRGEILLFFEKKEAQKKKEDEQQSSVSGTVIETLTQQPIPGVSIVVKGTTNGASTDAQGKYTLDVAPNSVLVFSSIGYKSVEINIGARSIVDVSLEEDITSFKEVIVNAGYYDVKENEATGSIVKVGSDIIEKQPVSNPLGALQGRMAGVYIQQTSGIPGSDFRIQIRGRNSLRSGDVQSSDQVDGNTPLYIVDGVPFSMDRTSDQNVAQSLPGGMSPLASLNPTDIESIEILKDADATAIYGSRGANGVVLITTKKGKIGKTKFDLNVYSGVAKAKIIDVLDREQYLNMRKEAFANDGITIYPANAYDMNGTWDSTRYTNWQKVLIGNTAKTLSVQSSLSGGNSQTQFIFSSGYRKETSVFPRGFGNQKGSTHLSLNHKSLDNRFTFNASISGTLDKNNQVANDYTGISRFLSPVAPPLYDENGDLNWQNNTWTNPLGALQSAYNGTTTSLIGSVLLGYEILPGLNIKSNFGLNGMISKETNSVPSTSFSPYIGFTSADSYVLSNNGSNSSFIIEPQATWVKKISKGELSVLGGGTLQQQNLDRNYTSYKGFPSNNLMENLASASIITPRTFIKSIYRYVAIFGRINYNWRGKYIVNLTARRDGSSRFGPGKQFANFGAIGAAWIFSNEEVLKNNFPFISFGKLRGSYGITGSDQIGNYQFYDTYTTTGTQYQGIKGIAPSKLYNPDFAWETNKKIEGAIEVGFFHDRLNLITGYYLNRSSNQLVNYTLPLTTGFSGILSNLNATVQNSGWEISLSSKNIQSDFKWTTSFNITIPRNKLLAFPNLESSTYANTYVLGRSLFVKPYYESTGVDPQTGYYTFTDFNGDGLITYEADRKKFVFTGQYFFGGINNGFTYKGWSLDVFLQFVKQQGYNYRFQTGSYGGAYNAISAILDETRWQKAGDEATLQRFATESNKKASLLGTMYGQASDAVIGDASFIRVKNISLSYLLPSRWTKSISCRLYMQAQNLFAITKYIGYDPESQLTSIPPLKMVTAGIQLGI